MSVLYQNVIPATFISRPNRFIADVLLDGHRESVHVKNTGRCRELLIPGAQVYLTASGKPGRKTGYDLVAVRKNTGVLFNIDSQAPNRVVFDWLKKQTFDVIHPEFRYGNSRIDFYMERANQRFLMEVKGCTLEVNGTGYFPDAPTERGVRHLHTLIQAGKEGYRAIAAFVIQMDGVTQVLPNAATHPAFASAWQEAEAAGVEILMLPCHVEPDQLSILSAIRL